MFFFFSSSTWSMKLLAPVLPVGSVPASHEGSQTGWGVLGVGTLLFVFIICWGNKSSLVTKRLPFIIEYRGNTISDLLSIRIGVCR